MLAHRDSDGQVLVHRDADGQLLVNHDAVTGLLFFLLQPASGCGWETHQVNLIHVFFPL